MQSGRNMDNLEKDCPSSEQRFLEHQTHAWLGDGGQIPAFKDLIVYEKRQTERQIIRNKNVSQQRQVERTKRGAQELALSLEWRLHKWAHLYSESWWSSKGQKEHPEWSKGIEKCESVRCTWRPVISSETSVSMLEFLSLVKFLNML